jgi:hypothetical protein
MILIPDLLIFLNNILRDYDVQTVANSDGAQTRNRICEESCTQLESWCVVLKLEEQENTHIASSRARMLYFYHTISAWCTRTLYNNADPVITYSCTTSLSLGSISAYHYLQIRTSQQFPHYLWRWSLFGACAILTTRFISFLM